MKLLEEIKRDHDKVRELFLQIDNKEEEGPEIFNTLVSVVLAHHTAEEQTAFEQLPDDKESQELKLELIAEHDSLRRAMQVVLETDPEDENWKARLMVCKEVFNHHIEEEEKELFEKLRSKLTDSQMSKLYDSFISAEKKSKTLAEGLVKDGMILRPDDFLPKEAAKKPAAKLPGNGKKANKQQENKRPLSKIAP